MSDSSLRITRLAPTAVGPSDDDAPGLADKRLRMQREVQVLFDKTPLFQPRTAGTSNREPPDWTPSSTPPPPPTPRPLYVGLAAPIDLKAFPLGPTAEGANLALPQ
jgi:hypothetical protein